MEIGENTTERPGSRGFKHKRRRNRYAEGATMGALVREYTTSSRSCCLKPSASITICSPARLVVLQTRYGS